MTKRPVSALCVVAAALALGACGGDDDGPLTSQEVFEKTKGGVVHLSGRLGDATYSGTGFFYDETGPEEGLVLTNAHVVEGLAALKARFGEGDPAPARVVGASPCNDLAVVQLAAVPDDATVLSFGDSDAVEAQDAVTALGYPGTISDDPARRPLTSSDGKVQAPHTSGVPGPSSPRFADLIQHDATINPGNSGGPLFNDQAEVIGVNTLGPGAGSAVENQFFSISSNHAQKLLPKLEAGNAADDVGWHVENFLQIPLGEVFPILGFGTQQQGEQTQQLLFSKNITGLWVWGASTGSPAEAAELQLGDLITHIEGTPTRNVENACDVLASTSPGQKVGIRGLFVTSGGAENFLKSWNTTMTMPD